MNSTILMVIYLRKVELNLEQVNNYLKGYELEIDDKLENGICVITYHNITIGGGKIVENKIKNYYPKNLRIN